MKASTKQSGFSLIELMIVVGIIGILATLAAPQMKSFSAKAKQSEAKTILNHIATLEETYAVDAGSYSFYAAATDYYGAPVSATSGTCTGAGIDPTNAAIGFKISPCDTRSPRYSYNIAADATGFISTAKTGDGATTTTYPNRVVPGCTTANVFTMKADRTMTEATAIPSSCL